ncbi:CaiB/BaiF CoA transferase family protein [Paraburkholderia caribensis]|uniref:CaiB/BaiF CoA transferase family protein n=1 Tax=Paraburkholderia caribensis TaxID=75105 RepID=UPI001CB0A39A|nr:CaiB/BaiF CoA-transferase family protein [Paraburkholderia caribensis]CAG9263088.1 Putative acyl-CoA transferase/carnitine dehydratase [Paraburkholderia caribensis]
MQDNANAASVCTGSVGALSHLKVVDLTRVLGGPFCTMILGDHGAEVIKVEPPRGDETRQWGPPFLAASHGRKDASYFIGVNRNKRSISIDISRKEGQALLTTMLADADVLIENFKPGTMEGWGIGYHEFLGPKFPRLVHCRISGFGNDGPFGGLPGYDAVLQAMTGLMSVNGSPETGPMRLGTPIVDLATGLYATIGILMALQERERSGRGQYVDTALYDCGMALLHPHAANFFLNGKRPSPIGNQHPNVVPCDKYRTRTGEIFVVIGNDGQFRKLVLQLGIPDLAHDVRFRTNSDRAANRDSLTHMLQEAFANEDGVELSLRLLRAGLPVGPVLAVDEALAAEQTASREMVVSEGQYRGVGTPIKLSRTPGGFRACPPGFAEHADELLEQMGLSESQISQLRDEGIIAASGVESCESAESGSKHGK